MEEKITKPGQLRRFLTRMNKSELHVFIKKNKIPAHIGPYSTKEGWIEEILYHFFRIEKYKPSKKRRRFNKELLANQNKVGHSVFGHRIGSRRAYMDRRLHQGVSIDELAKELYEEFDSYPSVNQAFWAIVRYLLWLPAARGISIMILLKPDPKDSKVHLLFDDGLPLPKIKRKIRKYQLVRKE